MCGDMARLALLRPAGPEPGWVYWVRRVLVLAVLAVVVLVGSRVLGGGGSSAARSPAGQPDQPRPTGTPVTSALPSRLPTSGSASPPPAQPCEVAALDVRATVAARDHPVGVLPRLMMTVTNEAALACTLDLSTARTALTVYVGSDRVWSSTDCSSPAPQVQTLLAGRATVARSVAWNRRRSTPSCASPSAQPLPPGTYELHGQLLAAAGAGGGGPGRGSTRVVDGGTFLLS